MPKLLHFSNVPSKILCDDKIIPQEFNAIRLKWNTYMFSKRSSNSAKQFVGRIEY